MKHHESTRREFLGRVGQGMIVASVGSTVAEGLGISTAFAEEGSARLSFGKLEPLVSLMQDTPIEKLQPTLVKKLRDGAVDLKQLVQAAALANARSFGGEDYVGMHTFMAFKPAYLMAQQLPPARRALVILKVLYRNTNQIHTKDDQESLHEVMPADLTPERTSVEMLRRAVHDEDKESAEEIFAAIAERSTDDAYNELLHVVTESPGVHRVVFAHRSWDILDLAGKENAHALLRQSLRYCLKQEGWSAKRQEPRTLLPKLLDEYKLLGRKLGNRSADDAWIDTMSRTIFEGTAAEAAEAVAAALAEGMSPDAVGEAISLATNQLVLRDIGRTGKMVRPGKPEGSVHGDSIGVHASDAANAWRGIARASNHRNTVACLILAGYQAALDRVDRGGDFLEWQPRPDESQLAQIKTEEAATLLRDLDGAIRTQDQAQACALVHKYGALGHEARPVLDLMLRYATSEDGALHAEKYYLTTSSDFASTRPAFRWRHLVGLARVTASESGQPAPGYAEACGLLKVEA